MKKNTEQMAQLIIATCEGDSELIAAVIGGLMDLLNDTTEIAESVAESYEDEDENENWYDEFRSDSTEVKVKGSIVSVTVARGHADEWHDTLRANGFRWSRKNHNWWAHLDDEKRAAVAKRNRENDAATAGMTYEQKQAYWAERRANRVA